jgi:hypothetical protein
VTDWKTSNGRGHRKELVLKKVGFELGIEECVLLYTYHYGSHKACVKFKLIKILVPQLS